MTRRAYISAPFWHPDPRIRRWNVDRALLLARLAAADGYEPVCVHGYLWDTGVDDDADPAARAAGIERGCAMVREIAQKGGMMYALWTDEMERTDGVTRELRAWGSCPHVEPARYTMATWRGYRRGMQRAGLLAEWAALVGVAA